MAKIIGMAHAFLEGRRMPLKSRASNKGRVDRLKQGWVWEKWIGEQDLLNLLMRYREGMRKKPHNSVLLITGSSHCFFHSMYFCWT